MNRQGMIRPYQSDVDFAARLADMVLVSLALWAGTGVMSGCGDSTEGLAAAVASLICYFCAEASGLSRPQRGEPACEEVSRLVMTWLAAMAVMLAAGFWTKTSAQYSRKVMA